MVRVEDLLPGFVERRVPDRPEWVASSPRDPRTAAEVYGKFALAFSTLFFALFAIGVFHAGVLLFVPLVVANATAWTWLLWTVRIPEDGTVSRRRALTTGFGIGTLSWLTVGPLMLTGITTARVLFDGGPGFDPLWEMLVFGLYFSAAGFVLTLGIPTVASVGLALWTLDYEERNGREKRTSNYDFQ